jgi:DNA-directed RNA polymerase specialized sigma24 family protein
MTRANNLAINAIKAWRWGKESPLHGTELPYSHDPELDPRVQLDEYGVYSDEIMGYLLPRQRAWVTMLLEGYTHQEIGDVYGVHHSNIGQTLRYAAAKVKEAGYEHAESLAR